MGQLRAREPQAHDEHIGVVPTARAGGGLGVRAQRRAHAAHLVRSNGRAGPGPAEQHTAVGVPSGDAFAHILADVGPLEVLAGGRPDEPHLGTARLEIGGDRVGERRPFVGSEHHAHGVQRMPQPPSRSCDRVAEMNLRSHALRLVIAIAVVAAVTAVTRALDVDLTTAALLLLVAVLGTSALGLAEGLAAAVVAFLALNWFFTEPTGSLKIQRGDDVVALIVFAVSAVIVGLIVERLEALRHAALRREQEARIRLDLTNRFLAGTDPDDALRAAADALRELFGFEWCALRAGAHAATTGVRRRDPNVVADAPGVHLEAATETPLASSDRALLDALVAGLATAVDRVRLEDEVREARVAAEVGRQRAGFLSAVSHNLRTPLTSVKAAASALLSAWSRIEPEERRELVETIYDESERLERLVQNTLELSRIRAGALEVDPERVDLADLVRHSVRRLRPLARAHRVRLDFADNLPDVWLDVTMADQILLNLLENALRYAPPGSEIVVGARPVDGRVELRVVDHGPGVPPDARERIFEEFQSAETRPDRTGTGLGLAIVRALVTAQEGDVRYEETPGGGATFVCTFPLGDGRTESARWN